MKILLHSRFWTFAAIALAAALLGAQGSDRARTEAQARRVSDRLQSLQREADALASQERSLLVDLRKLEVEQSIKTEQLKQITAERENVARELGTIGNQIDALESQESVSRPLLEARMVELYKLGGGGYLRLLLDVSNLQEFGRAYRMVSALAAIDRQRALEHQQNLDRLKAARVQLENRRDDMTKLQKGAADARAAAERAAVARSNLIGQIDARRDLTAQLAGELQAAEQRLQQTLGAMGADSARASVDVLPIRPFRGDLDWPVAGRVLTRFASAGAMSTPVQNGVQIASSDDATVRAVHDGTVAFSGPFTGYGNLVIIDHGSNVYSLYGQLDGVSVSRGAKVDRGQAIGTIGRILVGIPGLYFEMRVDGKPVDPLEWLKKRP
jgi:murein hydrolase activator